jgi:hypothetical protein
MFLKSFEPHFKPSALLDLVKSPRVWIEGRTTIFTGRMMMAGGAIRMEVTR